MGSTRGLVRSQCLSLINPNSVGDSSKSLIISGTPSEVPFTWSGLSTCSVYPFLSCRGTPVFTVVLSLTFYPRTSPFFGSLFEYVYWYLRSSDPVDDWGRHFGLVPLRSLHLTYGSWSFFEHPFPDITLMLSIGLKSPSYDRASGCGSEWSPHWNSFSDSHILSERELSFRRPWPKSGPRLSDRDKCIGRFRR